MTFVPRARVGLAWLAVVSACGGSTHTGDATVDAAPLRDGPTGVALPVANGALDYQLGGAYPPADDVRVLSRDREAAPVPGLYNICYVNGFQTQPGERAWWTANHPSLILRDRGGAPVIDPDWPDEYILDISTETNRAEIAAIVGGWIDGCATAGFQAIEVDNLDTYTRFATLGEASAVAMIRTYADRAHAAGLAIAQKNTSELLGRRGDTALDFAIVEECSKTAGECQEFVDSYGDQVYLIEYDRPGFTADCSAFPQISIVLRDRNVTPRGSPSYVRDAC